MKMKKHTNWQWIISLGRDYSRMDIMGWRLFTFGIFKFKQLPTPERAFNKEDYHGFLIQFRFWLPIERV